MPAITTPGKADSGPYSEDAILLVFFMLRIFVLLLSVARMEGLFAMMARNVFKMYLYVLVH